MNVKKQNDNCLIGMQCPQCCSLGPFEIDVITTLTVHDDGTGDASGAEWEDENRCQCSNCKHSATVADFARNITNANYVTELLSFLDVSQEFWDSLTVFQQNDMAADFEQARKGENLTGLTELQQQVIQHYEGGNYVYIKSVADAEKVGDGLFVFLLNEAGDASDKDEYIAMLITAARQIRTCQNEIEFGGAA
jgi:hypothetical protein